MITIESKIPKKDQNNTCRGKGIPQQNDTEGTKIFGFVPKKNSVKAVIFWEL